MCLIGFLLVLIQPCFSASVTIENYTPEELKNVLMKIYIQQGANIRNANDYQLVVDEKGSFWANFWGGSTFNPYVIFRTTYNFVQDNNNTIVNLNMAQIVNPNSAFENSVPIPEIKTQAILENMQKAMNGYYGYGFFWKKHRKYLEVLTVEPFTNNLKVGDKIVKVNNENIKGMSKDRIVSKLKVYDEDKEINLKIMRDKNEMEINLKSYFVQPKFIKKL